MSVSLPFELDAFGPRLLLLCGRNAVLDKSPSGTVSVNVFAPDEIEVEAMVETLIAGIISSIGRGMRPTLLVRLAK
jgi:hypothetical protein